MVDLGTLGGNYAQAFAINDNGQIVATAVSKALEHIVLFY
jgi:uncharacterized membrane protein